ncbi:MAG: B12-binding domain-containing radical SAM protein [Promethearchaeota archaeon]
MLPIENKTHEFFKSLTLCVCECPILYDICLFNWKTELDSPERVRTFMQSAKFSHGILHAIDLPLREPPTGLMLLAAILEQKGYAVDILDATLLEHPEQYIREHIGDYRLMGFTSLTNAFPEVQKIIRLAKQVHPEIFIVVGGPHVSFMPDSILAEMTEVDAVFIGEAENSFPWFVDRILIQPVIDYVYAGESDRIGETFNFPHLVSQRLATVEDLPKGIAFRPHIADLSEKSSGNLSNSYYHPFPTSILPATLPTVPFPDATDLKVLPLPARHLISRIYKVADIIVNRGCPNQCSFCSRTHLFPKMRIRPLDQVFEEVDYILSESNYKFVNFYDNINISKRYFETFLHGLIARPHMLPWGAELRSDGITLEQAHLMKKANCRVIATGIESASETVLKTNFKFQDIEAVRKGIINVKKAGVAVQAYFVIGLPGDTPSEFDKTLAFLESLPLVPGVDQVNFFVTTPYPGSDLSLNPDKYGINILSKPLDTYDCRQIQLETLTLKVADIARMVERSEQVKKRLRLS